MPLGRSLGATPATNKPENGDGILSGETIFGTFSDRELRSIPMLDFDLLCAFVAVAEGLDRALACLEAWGLLRGRAS